jgi:F0F1-type ATP synthase membrane subunit b/b'
MSEHSDYSAGSGEFELERRGYSRRQVDETVARHRSQIRDLEERLSHALDGNEQMRLELSSARQAVAEKPPHEEISERVGQILKLADDEAKSQRNRANDEIAKLRTEVKQEVEKLRADVKQETDKLRTDAHEQVERMLSAAQEQAEHSIASARSEAEKTRSAAKADAERTVSDANQHAESAVAAAKAQAKQQLDEATARATAIHDGAERRLNLLMSRHTEAIRRLTEIRDVVTTLVAGEMSRGSLEDEVARTVAGAVPPADGKAPARPAAQGEGRHATGGGPAGAAQPQAAGVAPQRQGVGPAAGPGPAAKPGEHRGDQHRGDQHPGNGRGDAASPAGTRPAPAVTMTRPSAGPQAETAETAKHAAAPQPGAARGPRPGADDDTAG